MTAGNVLVTATAVMMLGMMMMSCAGKNVEHNLK